MCAKCEGGHNLQSCRVCATAIAVADGSLLFTVRSDGDEKHCYMLKTTPNVIMCIRIEQRYRGGHAPSEIASLSCDYQRIHQSCRPDGAVLVKEDSNRNSLKRLLVVSVASKGKKSDVGCSTCLVDDLEYGIVKNRMQELIQ